MQMFGTMEIRVRSKSKNFNFFMEILIFNTHNNDIIKRVHLTLPLLTFSLTHSLAPSALGGFLLPTPLRQ